MKEEEGELQCQRGETKCLIIISRMRRKVEANITVSLACDDEDGASTGV